MTKFPMKTSRSKTVASCIDCSKHGMENNRIRKLLMSEYKDFYDEIFVESPFAETTRDGHGLRQVSLGLTPMKLIIAADILRRNPDYFYPPNLDPSIESFELVSVYPLEYVTLSVFRRRRRRSLKARFIDGKTRYYELGGMYYKKLFWKIWCEHVESLLTNKMNSSSLSETSVASSSSSSTFYLLSSGVEINEGIVKQGRKKVCRIWKHYGGAGDYKTPTWRRKDLYLGSCFDELANGRYQPIPIKFAGAGLEELRYELEDYSPGVMPPKQFPSHSSFYQNQEKYGQSKFSSGLCDVVFMREQTYPRTNDKLISVTGCQSSPYNTRRSIEEGISQRDRSGKISRDRYRVENSSQTSTSKIGLLAPKTSRFGFGVAERCNSGLHICPSRGDPEYITATRRAREVININQLIESGVTVWENYRLVHGRNESKGSRRLSRRHQHTRRYGLSTAAHFLYALGPWLVQPGDRYSVQRCRSFSLVTIRRQSLDPDMRLPVPRRQLEASVSCTALEPGNCPAIGAPTRGDVILFWTPQYWYRPRPAVVAYKELRHHLSLVDDFHRDQIDQPNKNKSAGTLLGRVFSGNIQRKRIKKRTNRNVRMEAEDPANDELRNLLRMQFHITVWDLDSTTLAEQMTLIDRDLFIRIPIAEIEILVYQRSSRNAPNLGAWIAFSHRIACLTSSEILSVNKLEMRSRIVARFVNVAHKCFFMGNFQSCRSILAGLQAPSIYRLKSTWDHLRARHSIRYETMQRLCKIYKSPQTINYRNAWLKAEKKPPCIPYVAHVLINVLGINEDKTVTEGFVDERFSTCPSSSNSKCLYSIISSNRSLRAKESTKTISLTNDIEELEEPKGLGRRILTAAFSKMRIKKTRSKLSCHGRNGFSTSNEQRLAEKYVDRWKYIVLKSRIMATERQRLKNMDPRQIRVSQVTIWFQNCQKLSHGYNFSRHSYAREFLLKARYKEDRENFFISSKLEATDKT